MRNSVIPPNQPEGDFALAGVKRSKSRKKEEDEIDNFLSQKAPEDHILSINYERSNSPNQPKVSVSSSFYPKLRTNSIRRILKESEKKTSTDLEEFRTQKLHLSPLPWSQTL